MLQPPDIPVAVIDRRLRESYGLTITGATFMPVGDAETAVYRIDAGRDGPLLLKLRPVAATSPACWLVPNHLRSLGIQSVMAPLMASTGMPVRERGFVWLVYPFIEGVSGFKRPLSQTQWVRLGKELSAVHSATLPSQMRALLTVEGYTTRSLDAIAAFDAAVETLRGKDPELTAYVELWMGRRSEIRRLADRTRSLRRVMLATRRAHVPCHGDFHAGNILLGALGEMVILDWDDAVMAPRERDLMHIGGGVGGVWNTPAEIEPFYEGYGARRPDPIATAYYRHERILADFAVYCARMRAGQGSPEDRRRDLLHARSQFDPVFAGIADRSWVDAGLER